MRTRMLDITLAIVVGCSDSADHKNAPPSVSANESSIELEVDDPALRGAAEPGAPPKRYARPRDLAPRKVESDTPFRPVVVNGVPIPDRDEDWLPDGLEVTLGTDPEDPDTDSDGLPDGWEVYGVNGINLPALGANPLRVDVFVEMDYMTKSTVKNGIAPSADVLRRITTAFAEAPITNPDGSTGIALHLEMGNEVPFDDDLKPMRKEFLKIKKGNFDPNRAPVYRYMIWAYRCWHDARSGYSLSIPGTDFVVTLGAWNRGHGGTDDQKVGSFLHELGHALGLHHGGSDDTDAKPNHLSVMNYRFQLTGVPRRGQRFFTYQNIEISSLHEERLDESLGLGRMHVLQGYLTRWGDDGDMAENEADASIDWDQDGQIDQEPVRVDLNGDGRFGQLASTSNEWRALAFGAGVIGSGNPRAGLIEENSAEYEEHAFEELTETKAAALVPEDGAVSAPAAY